MPSTVTLVRRNGEVVFVEKGTRGCGPVSTPVRSTDRSGDGVFTLRLTLVSPLLHRNDVVYLTFLLNEGSVNGLLRAYYMYCTLGYRLGPRYS